MYTPTEVGQSLTGNSPAGGSFHQLRTVKPAQIQSAAGSLAVTTGPINAAAQAGAAREAGLALRTAEHRATQTQLTLQAEAAAAQEVLNRHKMGALLGECHRCGKDPATLYLPRLAGMFGMG